MAWIHPRYGKMEGMQISEPAAGGREMADGTAAEYTRRLVRAAVGHLLENGLVVIAPDAEERMERGIPVRAPRG